VTLTWLPYPAELPEDEHPYVNAVLGAYVVATPKERLSAKAGLLWIIDMMREVDRHDA
jgi:hypothetical protein